jgi:hypothetical protein
VKSNSNKQRFKFSLKQRSDYYRRRYFNKLQKRLLYLGWAKFAVHKGTIQQLPKFEVAKLNGEPLNLNTYLCRVSTDNSDHVDLFDLADTRENMFGTAQECQDDKGCWPISFSSPYLCDSDPKQFRQETISNIVPGRPYSFDSQHEYYSEYAASSFAISHKKGGWDCFRHIEILMNGSILLMPDALEIPKFSMVHYPKKTFERTLEMTKDVIQKPSVSTREGLKQFFNENLTSRVMANYMLQSAKIQDAKKVLFIDHRLPFSPDYQSIFTLVGLKQIFGISCTTMQPVPYLYEGWRGTSKSLYGRGFGYARSLPGITADSHRLIMSLKSVVKKLKKQEYDLVVFGSIMRNLNIFEELRPYLDPARTIIINGEDLPPSEDAFSYMKDTRCHLFVRSIE